MRNETTISNSRWDFAIFPAFILWHRKFITLFGLVCLLARIRKIRQIFRLKFDGEQLKPHKLCIHHRIGTDEDDVIAPLSVIQSPILHLIIISSIYSYHFKLEIDVDWWWRRIPSLNQHLDINTHIRLEIILDFSLCERFKRPILFLFLL